MATLHRPDPCAIQQRDQFRDVTVYERASRFGHWHAVTGMPRYPERGQAHRFQVIPNAI